MNRPRARAAFLAACLAVLLLASTAAAEEPLEVVRENVENALDVLNDPALQGPENKTARRQKARRIVYDRFDFREISKRSLARHWKKRTEEEKHEFTAIFSEFLERSYMDRIEGHKAAKVLYLGEERRDKRAEVRTTVVTQKGTEVPINYRLLEKNGRWMVYDVTIEGVSLVSSYRSQFNTAIQSSSYEKLVEDLKKKLDATQ